MQNEISIPLYLQQHEIAKTQLKIFFHTPNAAESFQLRTNPFLMVGISILSKKSLMVFTGTDTEYSVEDYLNAVATNIVLKKGPVPVNTPVHQNWIHKRTASIQTTVYGTALKKFYSYLNILNPTGKQSHKNFRKFLTLRVEELYAMKIVVSQMK